MEALTQTGLHHLAFLLKVAWEEALRGAPGWIGPLVNTFPLKMVMEAEHVQVVGG